MNKQSSLMRGLMVLIWLLLASCTTTPSSPTVTVENHNCSYTGPGQVGPKFTLMIDIRDIQPPVQYMFAATILSGGATIEDLKAVTDWYDTAKDRRITGLRGVSVLAAGISTQDVDLTVSAQYRGEPIYIVCIDHSNAVFGVLGPLEVKP